MQLDMCAGNELCSPHERRLFKVVYDIREMG